ncbi:MULTISPECIES: hypothetical protein [unclassified Streptomyces]|uniref:hypothetical protein n=1 Tax=unclassified Streptomyces TaxID=2593676 RepID=UPI00225B6B28|nr:MULTISPECIES: hypothetical protein [unclassified Streptomyces]MCX5336231.1 hypothetical protein [Streptomyces sp. NBC_00140]MCX5366952.1 hypothetical protein [Streptomyces sp. NBC_00124]
MAPHRHQHPSMARVHLDRDTVPPRTIQRWIKAFLRKPRKRRAVGLPGRRPSSGEAPSTPTGSARPTGSGSAVTMSDGSCEMYMPNKAGQ